MILIIHGLCSLILSWNDFNCILSNVDIEPGSQVKDHYQLPTLTTIITHTVYLVRRLEVYNAM